MIYTTQPEDFNPKFEVSCCHVEHEERFLMLHRVENDDSHDGKWGPPAGKMNAGETPIQAAQRETQEETGLHIPFDQIKYRMTVYARTLNYDVVFHIFQSEISEMVDIKLDNMEHQDFRWIKPLEALSLGDALIHDEDVCIRLVYGIEAEESYAEGTLK